MYCVFDEYFDGSSLICMCMNCICSDPEGFNAKRRKTAEQSYSNFMTDFSHLPKTLLPFNGKSNATFVLFSPYINKNSVEFKSCLIMMYLTLCGLSGEPVVL